MRCRPTAGRVQEAPDLQQRVPKTVDNPDRNQEHEVFQTGDLAAEERWSRFATWAHEETGVCSILSLLACS